MELNTNNQLTLLIDLLDEHRTDLCGSVSEYQQITRLVNSLMQNSAISDQEIQELLPEIYDYGKNGESSQNMEAHITANNTQLATWIDALHQTNLH
ncbi:hypothetical protein CAI16_13830 [Virgibacillus dokdonensis]|uniref:YtzH-like protein n=2 Tax=Virgibacillus TaxID=84406 RepID=A0A1M5UYF1_9BACI|nr:MULTISPECIES: YtzH-like family protein [Virgibacillus]RFA33705.1 hypothetical protein CAI16_13830 [Virgibacillus dokdonensis]SHH67946.1 YtzH-like protein [Virgibacillus chiguensis]